MWIGKRSGGQTKYMGLVDRKGTAQRVKKQHYVPRMYLRHFTNDGEHIWTFDKPRRVSYRPSVMDVAVQKFFYDLPPEGCSSDTGDDIVRDPQFVEKALSQAEGRFAVILSTLLPELTRRGLSQEAKEGLAPFVGLQFVRSLAFRQDIAQLGEGINRAMAAVEAEAGGPVPIYGPNRQPMEFERFEAEQARVMQAQCIMGELATGDMARVLSNHVWFIGRNDSPMPFYTSDNPLVRHANVNSKLKSCSGIASEGIEVVLPLTPDAILIMVDRGMFGSLACYEGSIIGMTVENVWFYNSLQVEQSDRQVYCHMDEFILARELCEGDTRLCEPARTRLQITWGDRQI